MSNGNSNVLVIAPHPDDEAIGCGGSIRLHANAGAHVEVVFVTSGEKGLPRLPAASAMAVREQEARVAAGVLGISQVHFFRCEDGSAPTLPKCGAEALPAILERSRPSIIYVPHRGETHPDHTAAFQLLQHCVDHGAVRSPVEIRCYEVWTPLQTFHHVEDITSVTADKLRAIRAHQSQIGFFRYDRAVMGLNRYRGELGARCRFAEVFACEWR